MSIFTNNFLYLKRLKKILKWTLLSLLLLIVTAWIIINTEWGQNLIIGKITDRLSSRLKSEIRIRHASLSLFNRVKLDDVLIRDQQHDTLLYAGQVQMRITDWFFVKNNVDLKFIGLSDADIHISRADSVWNYQYLVDYFSSGSEDTGKKGGIAFDLKKVELKNFRLHKKDAWLGEDMILSLGKLNLDADEINFKTRKAEINSLVLTEPVFEIFKYARLKPRNINPDAGITDNEESVEDSSFTWNTMGWLMHAHKIKIDNGIFRNRKESTTPYFSYFDGRNIEFASIDGEFGNVRFINDSIIANLTLKAKEQSGFEVKSMKSDIRFMPTGMEFRNMEIITNNSIIRDYFMMSYSSIDDMGDFLNKVNMTGNFTDAEIDSDDISFFAPALSEWNKKIKFNGAVSGTVDDIIGRNLNIAAGRNTLLNGDIEMIGLPDINKTFIHFKADNFRTTYTDAVTFFPGIRKINTPDLRAVSSLHFKGDFTGFISDFVTYGTISTNLGTLVSDLNMKLPKNKKPIYSGNIASEKFNLGAFLKNDEIGLITFQSKIFGSGLEWKDISADHQTTINELVLNDYHYENILSDGRLDKKIFSGNFSINDSNAIASVKGTADFSGDIPRFNLLADVDRFNMQALKITPDNYSLTGKFDFNFAGSNIDNFLGTASLTDATISKDGRSLPIEYLNINSQDKYDEKILMLDSKELTARIAGKYRIRELPDAFSYLLHTYYPSQFNKPGGLDSDQAFEFEISSNYLDEYANLLDSNLHGLNNITINGNLNTGKKEIFIQGTIPSVSYKNIELEYVDLKANGTEKKLEFTGIIDQMRVSDSLGFPYTRIDITSQNDSSDITIITESDNPNIPGATLRARINTFSDGLDVKFDSSNFIVNGKNWTIRENGELEFRSGQVSYGEVILKESNQEILVKTQPSDIGNWNDLVIDLYKINIGDITSFITETNRFEGLASGKITVEDPVNRFNISADLSTEGLRIDNDSVGQLEIHSFYDNKTGILTSKVNTLNKEQSIDFDALIKIRERDTGEEEVFSFSFNKYPIKVIERFIGDLFTDLQGTATGNLKITGKGRNQKYTGRARLHDAGLKIVFTKCFYKIADAEIQFREDALDLGRLLLLDTATNNTATLRRGVIKHQAWRNMQFDIEAAVDNQPILLLNTGPADNSSFYGYARGTGTFSLKGPQTNSQMRINGVASNRDSSYITIPNTTSRQSGIADFLIERKYGREISDTVKRQESFNMTYNVELVGNPMVNVRVVLDDLTNDEIRGRGSGNLNIVSGTNEPLSIHGRYRIDEGSYIFSFQSFFKKPFELKTDTENYIEWTGDPYHPTVKIDALYETTETVDFSPLISSGSPTTVSSFSFRDKVYVIAKLRGDLFNPAINFELDFPEESIAKRDPSIAFTIQQLQKNENELNKQVAFLVVFNRFVPAEGGSYLALSSGTDLLVNSISGIISGKINSALNNFLSQQLKIPGLNINFSGSLYNSRPFGQDGAGISGIERSNLNLLVAKTILNNRVVLVFEGTADVPIESSTQVQGDLLKNFSTEFLINKSGTIRATLFYRENVDYLSGTTTVSGGNKSRKFGASLAYRREFNKLGDLFKSRKNKKVKETNEEEK